MIIINERQLEIIQSVPEEYAIEVQNSNLETRLFIARHTEDPFINLISTTEEQKEIGCISQDKCYTIDHIRRVLSKISIQPYSHDNPRENDHTPLINYNSFTGHYLNERAVADPSNTRFITAFDCLLETIEHSYILKNVRI